MGVDINTEFFSKNDASTRDQRVTDPFGAPANAMADSDGGSDGSDDFKPTKETEKDRTKS